MPKFPRTLLVLFLFSWALQGLLLAVEPPHGDGLSPDPAKCTGSVGGLAPHPPTPTLDKFSRDLTQMARKGELDPVIGRTKEVMRLIQVLMRRTKNNPVVLGEAGVGKTAIVEGLAQLIAKDAVPRPLRGYRVLSLNLTNLVAGTRYRGMFEERIKAILEEAKSSKKTLIFIDELHTMLGAGAAEGAMDASNILKPALSRGELQIIGATTLDEYRKFIEKDAALERRFQPVIANPPTKDDAVEILMGLRENYEKHHEVVYTDRALQVAVDLSDRYINGRHLPDKAIDVMDEAGARVRMKSDGKPGALVDEETIREVISEMTGIPLKTLDPNETRRLLSMEDELHGSVIGQDEAITRVSRIVRKAQAGMKDPKRPTANLLFAGPTGVGKTLLAKKLAKFLFGDERQLIQFDMSEYMEKHTVSRLIGSPPGYKDHEDGGQLTEKIRRNPYSVVLFDEIEKAHSDVWNMLLQIMEEGHLTDGMGRVIDFKNTIVILTSNVGAEAISDRAAFGKTSSSETVSYDQMKAKVKTELEKKFRPEFLNRLDDVIVFRTLGDKQLLQIADLELNKVAKRLGEKSLKLVVSDEAKRFIVKQANGAEYGGRALRRAVEFYVEEPLSDMLLRGAFDGAEQVNVGLKESDGVEELSFERG